VRASHDQQNIACLTKRTPRSMHACPRLHRHRLRETHAPLSLPPLDAAAGTCQRGRTDGGGPLPLQPLLTARDRGRSLFSELSPPPLHCGEAAPLRRHTHTPAPVRVQESKQQLEKDDRGERWGRHKAGPAAGAGTRGSARGVHRGTRPCERATSVWQQKRPAGATQPIPARGSSLSRFARGRPSTTPCDNKYTNEHVTWVGGWCPRLRP
jgi:hypothetical protein